MRAILLLFAGLLFFMGCKEEPKTTQEIIPAVSAEKTPLKAMETKITPVEHASFILEFEGKTIFVDPVGGAAQFPGEPDLILVTDIHPDHMDAETLAGTIAENTIFIAPKAVQNSLPDSLKTKIRTMNNGESLSLGNIKIEALPMYNLREEAKEFHTKGRGNGYLLESDDQRIYIAGDTEDIPEMRELKDIDIAFIPMNLPYTMPVESAADAVLEFSPKKVYPYHYRGQNGFSDIDKFKNLVETNSEDIQVIQLDWYPDN